MKKISKALGALGLSAGLVAGVAAVALAAPSNNYEPKVEVASSSAVQGGAVSLTVTGFLPGEDVTLTLYSDPYDLGTWKVDSTGKVTGTATLPSDISVGEHTIKVEGQQSHRVAEVKIHVAAKPAASTPGSAKPTNGMPAGATDMISTGSNRAALAVPLGFASVLLLAGGAFALRRGATAKL